MCALAPQIVAMSMHKFASNVVEKCLVHCGPVERDMLIKVMLGGAGNGAPQVRHRSTCVCAFARQTPPLPSLLFSCARGGPAAHLRLHSGVGCLSVLLQIRGMHLGAFGKNHKL